MSVHLEEPFQIRLLLSGEMVAELDSIAESRQISRLALIRRFLQSKIEEEFQQLEIFFEEQEKRKQIHRKLQDHLSRDEW